MKKILTLIALFSVASATGQQLRTMEANGFGDLDMGKMTYTYYEDESMNEVRHGQFKIIEKYEPSTGGKYSMSFTGTYQHGKPDGIWTLSRTETDFDSKNNWYETSSLSIKYSFKNGKPDGEWTFSWTGKRRKRIYDRTGSYTWGTYETLPSESATIRFKDGKLIGNLSVNFDFCNVSGKLNDKSQWDGEWVISKSGSRITCDNGIAKNAVMISVNNERNVIKYEPEVLALQEQFRKLDKDSVKQFVKQHKLEVDTVFGLSHYSLSKFNRKPLRFNGVIDLDKLPRVDFGYFLEIKLRKLYTLDQLINRYDQENAIIAWLIEKFEMNKDKLYDSELEKFEKLIERRKAEREEKNKQTPRYPLE